MNCLSTLFSFFSCAEAVCRHVCVCVHICAYIHVCEREHTCLCVCFQKWEVNLSVFLHHNLYHFGWLAGLQAFVICLSQSPRPGQEPQHLTFYMGAQELRSHWAISWAPRNLLISCDPICQFLALFPGLVGPQWEVFWLYFKQQIFSLCFHQQFQSKTLDNPF